MDFREVAVRLVSENGYRDLCEIGVWRGDLSRMLAPYARTLTLVDPLDTDWNNDPAHSCTMGEAIKTQEELDEMYDAIVRDLPQARFLRLPSLIAHKEVEDASLDFVFIDSVHVYTYALLEIRAWLPKVRLGGMIAGDDYVGEMADAVNEVLTNVNQSYNVWWWKI